MYYSGEMAGNTHMMSTMGGSPSVIRHQHETVHQETQRRVDESVWREVAMTRLSQDAPMSERAMPSWSAEQEQKTDLVS